MAVARREKVGSFVMTDEIKNMLEQVGQSISTEEFEKLIDNFLTVQSFVSQHSLQVMIY